MTKSEMIEKIKLLREETGVAITECRKALEETEGDLEQAKEVLRKKSIYVASNKSQRVTKEGLLITTLEDQKVLLLEINCETDFTSRSDKFQNFAQKISAFIIKNDLESINQLEEEPYKTTIDALKNQLILETGENIIIKRFQLLTTDKNIGIYNHNNKIGCVVILEGGHQKLANEVAIHIVGFNPLAISEEELPQDVIEKEMELVQLPTTEPHLKDTILQGKLAKFKKQNALLSQNFIHDNLHTVGHVLQQHNARIVSFYRWQLGSQ